MKKEIDSKDLDADNVVSETEVETGKEETGLGLRDALEVAYKGLKEGEKPSVDTKASDREKEETPDTKAIESPRFDPPSEYSKEEREDFLQLTPKQQQAALRLHKATQEYNRRLQKEKETIGRESNEIKEWRTLAENAAPFVKTLGVKEAPQVAINKALKLWYDLEHGDTKKVTAEILKAKGIEVPKEFLANNESATAINQQLSPLQNDLNQIKLELITERKQRQAEGLFQAWRLFEGQINPAGSKKYPSIDDSEDGNQLAYNIGTLVNGETELSVQFIKQCQQRIPDLTQVKLFEEAYKYLGGRIDDSQAPTKADTKHLNKAKRAASSIPGQSSQAPSNGMVKKFKTFREAAAHALEQIREQEGG